ncbi:MAG: hypothetical protein WCG45_05125 [bacterium]
MNRKPNCNCSYCRKEIYRRPKEIEMFNNVFCSSKCHGLASRKKSICKSCGSNFKPEKKTSSYCCRSCANVGRKGLKYTKKKLQNSSKLRLDKLKNTFKFESCMVENCNYNKTYDIHRLKEGKDGGKYEIGNMFAICPNHHAEVHRRLIKLEKINDYTLKEIKN